MASSFLNFVNNLSEEIHRIKCKFRHEDKKYETCETKYNYCNFFLECTNFKDTLIEYKGFCCNKSYQHKFDEKLKERYFNTQKFSNHDNNKFILLLGKGIYLYKYMDEWEKFNEDFYSHLNMEDITDAD